MTGSLLWEIRDLVWRWWRGDRIRTSPRDGQLLQIQPGDLLTVSGLDAEVVQRSMIEETESHVIRLLCEHSGGSAELRMVVSRTGELSDLIWSNGAGSRFLEVDDIQVWKRAAGRSLQQRAR